MWERREAPPVCTVLFTCRGFSKYKADRSVRRPGWREGLPARIVIGNPLMISQDFPPLHTVRESFPSYGVPSSTEIKVIYSMFRRAEILGGFVFVKVSIPPFCKSLLFLVILEPLIVVYLLVFTVDDLSLSLHGLLSPLHRYYGSALSRISTGYTKLLSL